MALLYPYMLILFDELTHYNPVIYKLRLVNCRAVVIFLTFTFKFSWHIIAILRSSRAEVFCKEGVLKYFTKFIEKHLRWSLRNYRLIRIEISAHVFSCKICIIFKVACMVKLKLAFMKWFFYNLVVLIKLHKIWYLNLGKAHLFPSNQALCLKYWKLWRVPTTRKFNIFCWNFAHVSYLILSY